VITNPFCFWSVVDGAYGKMARSMIRSARAAGVRSEFHLWSAEQIEDSACHTLGTFRKTGNLFKLHFLRDVVRHLPFDYFIWLDADNWFVRHPGNILDLMRGSPVHGTLESELSNPENKRKFWWKCPIEKVIDLMRQCGVASDGIFNLNSGFWIVRRDAVEEFCELALSFWRFCKKRGFDFNDEPPIAYAIHRLCPSVRQHTLAECSDVWATDWVPEFKARIPDGLPWDFTDYFTGKTRRIDPAIVRLIRCKNLLIRMGSQQTDPTIHADETERQ